MTNNTRLLRMAALGGVAILGVPKMTTTQTHAQGATKNAQGRENRESVCCVWPRDRRLPRTPR